MSQDVNEESNEHGFASEALALLRLGGPVIAAQLAWVSMNFVDTVMAGNLNPQSLAAVAVGGSLWFPLVVFTMGVLMAVTPNVAHAFGAEQYKDAGRHVRQGLWLAFGLGAVCITIVRFLSPLFTWMHVDPEIIPMATGYLSAISWGMPALCAFTVLRSFSEGVSVTRPMMWISLQGLVVNISGNYVLMHGKFGFPALGAVGCGWASAFVLWTMLASLAVYIAINKVYRPFAPFGRFDPPHLLELIAMLKLGVPIGLGLFVECSLFAAVALLMGTLGSHIAAGHQVAINVASVTFMVPLGLSVAITVRVGQALGASDVLQARRAGLTGMSLAVGFMACTALVMWTLPHLIIDLYTDDESVRAIAIDLLGMAAIFQIADGLQVASAGALRGLKDTRIPMFITVIAYWGLGMPLAYWLGIVRGDGPQAMWVGLIVGLATAAVLLHVRFRRVIGRKVAADYRAEESVTELEGSGEVIAAKSCDC